MELNTSRFGTIQFEENDIIQFPEGIIGFTQYKRYLMYERPQELPFMWLQCIDDPSLAFVIVDPSIFYSNYTIKVSESDVALLGLADIKDAKALVIVVIPTDDPGKTRANLRGPLVINPANKIGRQLVLSEEYPLQYFIFAERTA